RLLLWRIACDPSHTYVLINVALSKAVRNDGGTVRRSEETDDGNTLLFTVGTRKYDTHRLTFTRAAPSVVTRPPLPKLALVIDDLGYSRNGVVKDILSIDLPLTISVLPSLPYSTFALERAQKEGKCTILHLPMEPDEEQGSDLPMVTTEMETRDIQRLVERYIQSMPGIEGVNNHQGSRATADRRVVDAVMDVIKAYDLYFLDSLTSSKSIAYNAAKDMGIASARNNGFLDADTEDPEVVERRIRQLVATAKERGTAIGIGHPRPWTLEALENTKVFLKNADVELVFLSDIVN
ncbi:MAG: divergent polysaccharide deacetylase family protein, partial [Candidatus Krumholzibacteria bacterium]|nr:divergent polysaccharide deacetylase family protein [Candidatus Krumholzibacteria bacterium]